MSADGITPVQGVQPVASPSGRTQAQQPFPSTQSIQEQAPAEQTQAAQPQAAARQAELQQTARDAQAQRAEQAATANQAAQAAVPTPSASGTRAIPRPDLSPLQNAIRDDLEEKLAIKRNATPDDPTPPPIPVQSAAAAGEYPDIDTRLLQRDFFDSLGEQHRETQAGVISELYALRAALLREVERIDSILNRLL